MHSWRYTVSTEMNLLKMKSRNSYKEGCKERYGFGSSRIEILEMICFSMTLRSCEQLSITSYEKSRLLWHIFNDPSTHLVISRQN